MSDVRLRVNGREYGGWESVRITRAMDTLVGSFELRQTDRWTKRGQPMAIRPQDACTITIDGETILDGYVDARPIELTSSTRTQSARGRDRAGDVYDSSVPAGPWTRRGITLLELAQTLCAPHAVSVAVAPGVTLPAPPAKFVINPGDTVFEVLSRESQAAGVLLLSDGAGGLIFSRSGVTRAPSLVQGVNLKSIGGEDDDSERFARYVVYGQSGKGSAANVRGEAGDPGVRRGNRVHVARPMSATTEALAQQYADWMSRTRAGRARSRTGVVHGWRQRINDLQTPIWRPNTVSFVDALAADVQEDMIIAGVTYSLSRDSGETTSLRLVRPDTFLPEPE